MKSHRYLFRLSKLFPYLQLNYLRGFKLLDLYQPTYNPRSLRYVRPQAKWRSCEDRIDVIRGNVDLSRVGSYLDLGSQLGYFVFRLCEINPGMIGHGMEMHDATSQYASAVAIVNDVPNVGFSNVKLTAASVKRLPCYDMISFLSVWHHIVHFDGFEDADRIMRTLYVKCNEYFVFETGQPDEHGYYWSESLRFMGDQPEQWLEKYLKDIGYSEVHLVHRFPTHLSDRQRAFFVCRK